MSISISIWHLKQSSKHDLARMRYHANELPLRHRYFAPVLMSERKPFPQVDSTKPYKWHLYGFVVVSARVRSTVEQNVEGQ